MIPKWIYELMAKDRAGRVMDRDEHNQPIEERIELQDNNPKVYRAHPRCADYPSSTPSTNKDNPERY